MRMLLDRQIEYKRLIDQLRNMAVGKFTLNELALIQETCNTRIASSFIVEVEEKFYTEQRIERLRSLLHR